MENCKPSGPNTMHCLAFPKKWSFSVCSPTAMMSMTLLCAVDSAFSDCAQAVFWVLHQNTSPGLSAFFQGTGLVPVSSQGVYSTSGRMWRSRDIRPLISLATRWILIKGTAPLWLLVTLPLTSPGFSLSLGLPLQPIHALLVRSIDNFSKYANIFLIDNLSVAEHFKTTA